VTGADGSVQVSSVVPGGQVAPSPDGTRPQAGDDALILADSKLQG
jgi:hypothetical protein